MLQFFQKPEERLSLGIQGIFPKNLTEQSKGKAEIKHPVNETLTRPWIRHYFIARSIQNTSHQDDIISRDKNLVDIFKTTVPLAENSFLESGMTSWRMFIDSAFRDSDTQWYAGIRKTLNQERLHSAVEQLELEIPASNPQHLLLFYDHTRSLRKIPRIPIKLFFAISGNEKEKLTGLLQQAVHDNPHNLDVALLTYSLFKSWERSADFLDLARTESRNDLEEWYFWVEKDLQSVGSLKRDIRDYATSFYIYDRAQLGPGEQKEIADWFLKESEFKSAYHFYYKAKEFEAALDLLQNISIKEFGELVNQRRISRGEKTLDLFTDNTRISSMYNEEMETLRGFARIRSAEIYKQVSVKARQHFDRETIETKYAFGELSEDEYQRLLRQLQERKQ